MKLFHAVLMAAVAAFMFTATAEAGSKDSKNANQVGVDKSVTLMQGKGNTFKEVHYEGNKKITTTYKAVGTRKVGLVGQKPYAVNRNSRLTDGGSYYTQDGVRYFRDTKKLDVEYQGAFND